MALADPYATAPEYRARVTKTDTSEDATTLIDQLKGVSRWLDRELRRFFNIDAAVVTRTFDGNGATRLWLPRDIATTTGLIVKVDDDADWDYDYTLAIGTDFWVGPPDADKDPEPWPWQYLEVNPNGQIGQWPDIVRSVQVTAKFGWPAVPQAIKELTVMVTRNWRDMLESGMAVTLQNLETAAGFTPDARLLWRDVQRTYARPTRYA